MKPESKERGASTAGARRRRRTTVPPGATSEPPYDHRCPTRPLRRRPWLIRPYGIRKLVRF